MVVVNQVAQNPAIGKRTTEVVDRYTIDSTDFVTPLKKKSEHR
jgi:hypothetical protein